MRAALIMVAAALALAGCARNETARVNRELRYDDRPARVTCQGYGGLLVDTISTGAVERDADGVLSFIDGRTGRPVKVEGECIVEHLDPVQAVTPAQRASIDALLAQPEPVAAPPVEPAKP